MPKLSRVLHNMLASGQINRREANHLQAEADKPVTMIKLKVGNGRRAAAGKARRASDDAKREAGQRVTGGRRVRNNFREY